MTRKDRRWLLLLLLIPISLMLWIVISRDPHAPTAPPSKTSAAVSQGQARLRSERRIVYPAGPLEPGYVPLTGMESNISDSETDYVLAGTIRTIQETSLEGATVSLMSGEMRSSLSDARPVTQPVNPVLSVASDAQGEYRIASTVPIRNVMVIRKEGYITIEDVQHVTKPGTVVRNYWMWPAPACVEGRVFDDSGNPVRGASVSAGLLMANGYIGENMTLQPVEATTDNSGSYSIYNLPDSELNVPRIPYAPVAQKMAQGNGRVTARNLGFVGETRSVRFVAGPCSRVDFRLRAARVVSFAVKDRRGEIIPQARIETSLAGNF